MSPIPSPQETDWDSVLQFVQEPLDLDFVPKQVSQKGPPLQIPTPPVGIPSPPPSPSSSPAAIP